MVCSGTGLAKYRTSLSPSAFSRSKVLKISLCCGWLSEVKTSAKFNICLIRHFNFSFHKKKYFQVWGLYIHHHNNLVIKINIFVVKHWMSSQSLVNPLMANLSSQAYPAQFNEEMDQSFSFPLFTHVTVLSNSPLGIICPDITLDKVSLTLGTGSWLMLSKQGRRCLENISKGSDWSSSTARHIWTKL